MRISGCRVLGVVGVCGVGFSSVVNGLVLEGLRGI